MKGGGLMKKEYLTKYKDIMSTDCLMQMNRNTLHSAKHPFKKIFKKKRMYA